MQTLNYQESLSRAKTCRVNLIDFLKFEIEEWDQRYREATIDCKDFALVKNYEDFAYQIKQFHLATDEDKILNAYSEFLTGKSVERILEKYRIISHDLIKQKPIKYKKNQK